MFVRDIAPELARDRDFEIVRERPGQLVFSDGVAPGSDVEGDLEESSQEREDRGSEDAPIPGNPTVGLGVPLNASLVPDDLPALFARHIRVDFSPEGNGTLVHVDGHLERDVRHGLDLLGTPQHWPETADQRHD